MANKKIPAKVQLGVLVYKDQMKAIDVAAKKLGMSRSSFVRYVVLKSLEK
jgi:ACT domain-containing protein